MIYAGNKYGLPKMHAVGPLARFVVLWGLSSKKAFVLIIVPNVFTIFTIFAETTKPIDHFTVAENT